MGDKRTIGRGIITRDPAELISQTLLGGFRIIMRLECKPILGGDTKKSTQPGCGICRYATPSKTISLIRLRGTPIALASAY